MKVLVALSVFTIVALAYGTPYYRDCYYHDGGSCYNTCEEGTHSYKSICDPMTPELTCEEPNPVPETEDICDYSACYCNSPTLRDSISGKCVQPEECPKKEKETPEKE